MYGTMRIQPIACALCLVAALAVPWRAEGQPASHRVFDANRLFSIALPADWQVADSAVSDAMFAGVQKSRLAERIVSKFAAHSALDDPVGPAILAAIAFDLPVEVEAAAFGTAFRDRAPSNWTVTGSGPARIAGRDAYYIYFITQPAGRAFYGVMIYFPVGRTGFLVIGSTYNEPAAIQKHFATISRALETFRPGDGAQGTGP
jgi:hypothetical protein